MKLTKTFKPYTKEGRCTLQPKEGTRAGVYIIGKKINGKPQIVYVGYSATNLYKTMYRHFQNWNDTSQQRVTYKQLSDVFIRVVFCGGQKAALLEEALILKYKPRDNNLKLELYTERQRDKIISEFTTEAEFIPLENVPF